MTPDQEQQARRIIAQQIAMSSQTLDALQRAGLSATREIQLDFTFKAPDEISANTLAAHLKENDCLAMTVRCSEDKGFQEYFVDGKTYPTVLNAQILGQWLPWIIVKGVIRNCEFDGWGAEV